MKRTSTPEYLGSRGGFTPGEIAAALADLRMINRWFGGTRVARKLIQRVLRASGQRNLRWLDVAGASGDIATSLASRFSRSGIHLQAVLLDRAVEHLPKSVTTVQGDALALPFRDDSFDVVGTSLLVHDLEPAEVQKFVREALRVARTAVVINEIRRNWMHLGLIYAGMPLFSRITRHDAPASVKKAYTPAELREIIGDEHDVHLERFYLCRMGVIVWKNRNGSKVAGGQVHVAELTR
jgi:2-polyprenyl-3-methyl-5-hydroxy-6-metoxy-1,4-benzoquinol methylase